MVVTIAYEDLISGKDLSEQIFEAYGPNGLGALTVSGIPGYKEARERLVPLAYKVAHLPEEEKKEIEDEKSMYNVGWSFGKEKFGDKPDYAKGSFYANPLYDKAAPSEDMKQKYPFFYPDNLWPRSLPEVEVEFKELGTIMYNVVVLLTKQIDKIVKNRIATYDETLLHKNIHNTRKIKGRLLYYFPTDNNPSNLDGWIGWHNDSGFFTALTCDMYFDDETGERIQNPDPMGGLWIVQRGGEAIRVHIPEDHLAIQCGECLQVVTGGLLVATPHCVRASISPNAQRVGRATFPVFVDTDAEFNLDAPEGISIADVFDKTVQSKVPPLSERWENGVPFVDFLGRTFKQYYDWAVSHAKVDEQQ